MHTCPLQVKLRETVQPLINKARGTHCEQCLSKKQLQLKLIFELENVAGRFALEHPAEEFDKVSTRKMRSVCLRSVLATVFVRPSLPDEFRWCLLLLGVSQVGSV